MYRPAYKPGVDGNHVMPVIDGPGTRIARLINRAWIETSSGQIAQQPAHTYRPAYKPGVDGNSLVLEINQTFFVYRPAYKPGVDGNSSFPIISTEPKMYRPAYKPGVDGNNLGEYGELLIKRYRPAYKPGVDGNISATIHSSSGSSIARLINRAWIETRKQCLEEHHRAVSPGL